MLHIEIIIFSFSEYLTQASSFNEWMIYWIGYLKTTWKTESYDVATTKLLPLRFSESKKVRTFPESSCCFQEPMALLFCIWNLHNWVFSYFIISTRQVSVSRSHVSSKRGRTYISLSICFVSVTIGPCGLTSKPDMEGSALDSSFSVLISCSKNSMNCWSPV